MRLTKGRNHCFNVAYILIALEKYRMRDCNLQVIYANLYFASPC